MTDPLRALGERWEAEAAEQLRLSNNSVQGQRTAHTLRTVAGELRAALDRERRERVDPDLLAALDEIATDVESALGTPWPSHVVIERVAKPLRAILARQPDEHGKPPREGTVDLFATALQETGTITVFPGDEMAALAALRAVGIDRFTIRDATAAVGEDREAIRAELDRLLSDAHAVPDSERDVWADRLAKVARATPRPR